MHIRIYMYTRRTLQKKITLICNAIIYFSICEIFLNLLKCYTMSFIIIYYSVLAMHNFCQKIVKLLYIMQTIYFRQILNSRNI